MKAPIRLITAFAYYSAPISLNRALRFEQAAADADAPHPQPQKLCLRSLLLLTNRTHTHTHKYKHTHYSYACAAGVSGQTGVATVGVGRWVPDSMGDQDGHYHVLLPRFRRYHA